MLVRFIAALLGTGLAAGVASFLLGAAQVGPNGAGEADALGDLPLELLGLFGAIGLVVALGTYQFVVHAIERSPK